MLMRGQNFTWTTELNIPVDVKKLAYLSSCQGNKVIDSERDDLPKQADDDPTHLVTSHCDVKKHLHTHTQI